MEPTFSFHPLTRADLPLLHEWLNRAHVAEWWGDQNDLESVLQSKGADLDSPLMAMFLAHLGAEPVGFIQACQVLGADPEWWTEETDPGVRGIDQFLANAEQLGQGLGSSMVRQFLARLFADPLVTSVQTDPSPKNGRAIRAYEKAGFRRVREIVTPDGPALLMRIERADFGHSAR